MNFKKTRLFNLLTILTVLLILGCQPKMPVSSTVSSSLYDFCIKNNGELLNGYPKQCVYQEIVYFNGTDNAINLFSCNVYFDGCNNCRVSSGAISGCTKMACSNENFSPPKCVEFNETLRVIKPNITAKFVCNEGDFVIKFDNTAHTSYLISNESETELPQVISASGARYSNQKITFFNKGNDAFVYDAKNSEKFIFTNCTAK